MPFIAWYKRIRDLWEDSDKTQTEVAEFLGTTAQYYGKYKKGERELPFMRAIQLAEYYDVSLDYIAGRTNHPKGDAKPQFRKDELELVHQFSQLSERSKGRVEQFVEQLLEQEQEDAAREKEAK